MSYFTQAGNFVDPVGTNVDPRTGLFTATIELAKLVGNRLRGPHQTLALSYAPLVGDNCGFGRGWQLNWTSYDTNARKLYVATGETYKVNAGAYPSIRQQKLKSFAFERYSDNSYGVRHASGGVEVLSGISGTVLYPKKLFSPMGEWLSVEWDPVGDNSRIAAISDSDENILLSASYGSGSAVFTVWPHGDEDEKFLVEASLQEDILQSITIGDWTWKFTYDNSVIVGDVILNKVEHPSGLTEEVEYVGDVMQFPDSPTYNKPLPCVSTYTKRPGGSQPDIVVTYDFRSISHQNHNYLGFGGDIRGHNDDDDNAYNIIDKNYLYSSIETHKSGKVDDVKVERTYNYMHLLVTETVSNGDCVKEKNITYDLDGQDFDALPDYFQSPQTITTQYKNGSDVGEIETEIFEYYTDGSRKKHVDTNGTSTEWAYYDRNEDQDGCPANPSGIVNLLKSKTVTTLDVSTGSGDTWKGESYTIEYEYKKLPLNGMISNPVNPVEFALLKSKETVKYFDESIFEQTIDYYDDISDAFNYGRIKTEVKTFISEKVRYSANVEYSYDYDSVKHRLTTTSVATSHDNCKATTKVEYACLTGRKTSGVDALGVKTSFTYDIHGQEVSRTLAEGSQIYARTITSTYEFVNEGKKDAPALPVHTITLPNGVRFRQRFDGMMRILSEEYFIGGDWRKKLEQDYDSLGAVALQSNWDYRTTSEGSEHAWDEIVNAWTKITYDGWAQKSLLDHSDGSWHKTEHDAVNRTSTTSWSGGDYAAIITEYDKRLLPMSVTRYDKKGNPVAKEYSYYDGMNRLRLHVDALGNRTSYTYDHWGRMASETLPDGTTVINSYAPDSGQPLITCVQVQLAGETKPSYTLGKQSFDGCGRVLSSENGGRAWSFTYPDAGPHPATATAPDGTKLAYTYIPELGSALSGRRVNTAGGLSQSFEYDKITGLLSSAKETGAQAGPALGFEYDDWGQLKKRTYTYGPDLVRTEMFQSSAFGLPMKHTDVSGIENSYKYNVDGTRDSQTNGNASVSFGYTAGLLSGWEIFQSGVSQGRVSLERDEFHREISRTGILPREQIRIVQEFDNKSGAITSRDLYTLSFAVDKKERLRWSDRYQYDSRSRLVDWRHFGEQEKHAPSGQNFVYDALDNIKQCIATSWSGKTTTTNYYFSDKDPCQLVRIENDFLTGNNLDLKYNARGQLIQDDAGRQMSYDTFGRLASVTQRGKKTLYSYDAHNERRLQILPDTSQVEFYYGRHFPQSTIHRKGGTESVTRWLYAHGNCLAQLSSEELLFMVTDAGGTVMATGNKNAVEADLRPRMPYGYTVPGTKNKPTIGLNGEYVDSVSGHYHLGNGYRAFSPTMMRFNAPDSLSPFGGGGLNPYAYCLGDPINRRDPSGHLSGGAWATIAVTAAILIGALTAIGFGIVGFAAAAAAEVPLGMGGAETVDAMTSAADGAATQLPKAASQLPNAASQLPKGMQFAMAGIKLGTGVLGLGAAGTGIATAIIGDGAKTYTFSTRYGEETRENGAAKTAQALGVASSILTGLFTLFGLFSIDAIFIGIRNKFSKPSGPLAETREPGGLGDNSSIANERDYLDFDRGSSKPPRQRYASHNDIASPSQPQASNPEAPHSPVRSTTRSDGSHRANSVNDPGVGEAELVRVGSLRRYMNFDMSGGRTTV